MNKKNADIESKGFKQNNADIGNLSVNEKVPFNLQKFKDDNGLNYKPMTKEEQEVDYFKRKANRKGLEKYALTSADQKSFVRDIATGKWI